MYELLDSPLKFGHIFLPGLIVTALLAVGAIYTTLRERRARRKEAEAASRHLNPWVWYRCPVCGERGRSLLRSRGRIVWCHSCASKIRVPIEEQP
jgi:hypothetical protein